MVPRYSEAGPVGVYADFDGVVALDSDGAVVWKTSGYFGGLSSHPELPGRVLAGSKLLQLQDGKPEITELEFHEWATASALFPSEGGAPVGILAGSRYGEVGGMLARFDSIESTWSATTPVAVGNMTMIEIEGRERLFVATGSDDDYGLTTIYVFDESGSLKHQGDLPAGTRYALGLTSGRFDDGTWGIAVTTSDGAYYYKLNVDLLD